MKHIFRIVFGIILFNKILFSWSSSWSNGSIMENTTGDCGSITITATASENWNLSLFSPSTNGNQYENNEKFVFSTTGTSSTISGSGNAVIPVKLNFTPDFESPQDDKSGTTYSPDNIAYDNIYYANGEASPDPRDTWDFYNIACTVTNDTSDDIPPSISGITLSGTPESSATSVTFIASFDQSVINVDTTDFELTTTGTATGVISSVSSSSGTSINVTVGSISGIGTLRLDLKTSHNLTNSSSMSLSGGYSSGSLHSVDFSPAVPQFLTVTALNDTQMYVNWDDNSTNEDNFNLYSSTDGSNFELNETFGADTTSTTVMNLNAETTYYFRVGVINGYGENNTSDESNTTLAYIAPAPIESGGNTNSTQIELSWSNNSIIETGYKIYTNGGNKITVGKNITSKIMTGLAPDTTYNFRIDTYIHIPIIFTSGIDIVIGTQNATLKTNDPAEFTFLTNQTKNEDFDEFNLTISNIVDNDSDNIVLTVESNDSSILTLTPSWTNNLTQSDYNDTNFTIGVLAIPNANGVVEVNVNSYDGKDYITNTFNIVVNGVDDNATVTSIDNIYRDINFSEFNVSFNVDDVDFNDLNITVDVNDTSLVDINQTWVNDLDYAEYNSTELNLTIKSKPNVEGIVRFTISAEDNQSAPTTTFDLNISAYNYALADLNAISLPQSVSSNIALPTVGNQYLSSITWSSNNSSSLSSSGVVNRPVGYDATVVLTATLRLIETVITKNFNITVLGLPYIPPVVIPESSTAVDNISEVSVDSFDTDSGVTDVIVSTDDSGSTVADISYENSDGSVSSTSLVVAENGIGETSVSTISATGETVETKVAMGDGVTTGVETNGDIKSSIALDSGVELNLVSGTNGVSSDIKLSSGESVAISIPAGADVSIGKDGLTTSFPTSEGDVKTTITPTGEIKVAVVTTTGESINFNSTIANKTEVDSSGSITQSFNLTDMVADLVATKRAEVKGKFQLKSRNGNETIEINAPKGSELNIDENGVSALSSDSNYNSNLAVTADGVDVNIESKTRANERNVTYSSRRDASNIKVEVLFPKKSRFRRVERGQIRSNYSYRREISKTLTQNRSSESNLTITPNGEASFEENLYFDGSENLNLKSGNVLVNGSIGDSEFNLDGAEKFNLNDNGTFEASKSSENSTGSLTADSTGELRVDFYSENSSRARLSKNRVSYSPRRDISNVKVDFLFDESNQRRVGSDRVEVKYSARRAFSFSKERATESFTITPTSNDATFKEYVYSDGEYQIELLSGEATITVDNNSSSMVLNQIYNLPNLEIVEDKTYQSRTLSHTLNIEKGWNLLASPVESDITDFFIFGDFDKIWLYDENIWSKNPDTIPYYRGFWIKANDNSSIEFSGESYLKNLETLQEGWSLISLGDTVEDNISNSTYKIEDIFVYRDNSFKKLRSINELNYAEATWIKKREATEHLTLNQGWNLASVPVVKNIDDFSIFSDYKSIKVYREDSWVANPDSIIPTEGFWIDMEEALDIPFYGAKFEADLTDVYSEKWHLKGGYIEDISKHDFEFWIYRNQKWLSNKLNNLKEIKAGEGFWVK